MKNWVYDFDSDLPAGVRCSFTLKAGLTALDGHALDGEARYEFNTGGPAIMCSLPYEGSRIPGPAPCAPRGAWPAPPLIGPAGPGSPGRATRNPGGWRNGPDYTRVSLRPTPATRPPRAQNAESSDN